MGTNSVTRELQRIHRDRVRELTRLAARVRRELIVPLCKRYDLRYNVTALGRLGGGSCFAFITRGGKLIESAEQARKLGMRFGRVFPILCRNIDDPALFGGDNELGNYIRPYGMDKEVRRGH